MNVEKLRDKMYRKHVSVDGLCEITGMDRSRMYRRLKDGKKMTLEEAKGIAKALSLTNEEAIEIFLT